MRQKIVAANWKMNTTPAEGELLVHDILGKLPPDIPPHVLGIIFPPFTHLGRLARLAGEHHSMHLGAQNVHWEEKGAFTGEISAAMLAEVGVEYVIIGHSERRHIFWETDEQLARKVSAALSHGLKPVFCCGELLEQREAGQQEAVVTRQLEEGLFFLPAGEMQKVIIAYEPVWAIGTGQTATPEQAQEMHALIRSLLTGKYDETLANEVPILYGGSVKPGNARGLFSQPDVDGGLIGGASLNAADYTAIFQAALKV